ncbi:MAG: hypothetical protein GC199_03275 [Alphaproteobacteria bacterium]|nr:hypothetical protein [Alphaproteobacteria bacterium]
MTRLVRRLGGFGILFCVLLLAVAGVIVVAAMTGRAFGFLQFLATFAGQATALAAIITVTMIFVRKARIAIAGVCITLIGVATVAPIARVQPCAAGQPDLRVMFFNVWRKNADIEDSMRYVRESGADIVGLVELRPEMMAAVESLRDIYPYMTTCERWGLCLPVVLSRYPLEDLSLDDSRDNFWGSLRLVNVPALNLTFATVHLMRPWPFRNPWAQYKHANWLIERLGAIEGPTVVVGDFNAVTWSRTIRHISNTLDLTALTSAGTWPVWLPASLRLPIDQGLVSSGIACAAKTTLGGPGSDHAAIAIDLGLTPRVTTARGDDAPAP